MKALYRRYRPQTLGEVVGQKQITDVLARSIKEDKVAHAYLFIGPRGTGKTSVARILAHEVNGFKYELDHRVLTEKDLYGLSNELTGDSGEIFVHRGAVLVVQTND